MDVTLTHIRKALALPGFDEDAARDIMGAKPRPVRPSQPWREGAVLVLLYPGEDGLTLVLTRRTDTVEHHRGQIAFPGGRREDGEELVETALRETEEEIGIPAADVEVLGELPVMKIPPSAFKVSPFVGTVPSRPRFTPDPTEVAGVVEVPFSLLLDESRVVEEERPIRDVPARIPYYDVPGIGSPPLWGATAMMLSGLVERVKAVMAGSDAVSGPSGRHTRTTFPGNGV